MHLSRRSALSIAAFGVLAVFEDGDDGGRRRDAFLHERLAHERVDERAFARIELADDDQQKDLVELRDRPIERRLLLAARVATRKRRVESHQQTPFFPQECLLSIGQYAGQHILSPCTNQTTRQV